jgi:hypothetical protein
LLRDLAPECRLDLVELIRGVLPGWNASVEQLPHYLIDRFGQLEFARAVAVARAQVDTEPSLVLQLERFLYWAVGWRART